MSWLCKGGCRSWPHKGDCRRLEFGRVKVFVGVVLWWLSGVRNWSHQSGHQSCHIRANVGA